MNLDSISEKKSAGITTSGISFINFPSHPGRKSIGTNATILVMMAKVTGMATKCVPMIDACKDFSPFEPRVYTDSPTTIASSTKIPSTTINANKETRLIDAPTNPMVAKAPMNEIGRPIATQMARDGRRKSERTRNTSNNPWNAFRIIISKRPCK